jgi:hypothetical protein
MKLLALLLIATLVQGCSTAELNSVNWAALSQSTNQQVYGNPQGQLQQAPPQKRVDLKCVQNLRAQGYSFNFANSKCEY